MCPSWSHVLSQKGFLVTELITSRSCLMETRLSALQGVGTLECLDCSCTMHHLCFSSPFCIHSATFIYFPRPCPVQGQRIAHAPSEWQLDSESAESAEASASWNKTLDVHHDGPESCSHWRCHRRATEGNKPPRPNMLKGNHSWTTRNYNYRTTHSVPKTWERLCRPGVSLIWAKVSWQVQHGAAITAWLELQCP